MSNPQNMLLKVRFYIISLWLLFFLVTICTIKIPCIQTPIPIRDKIKLLLETNIFPIISFIFCILCFVLVSITYLFFVVDELSDNDKYIVDKLHEKIE